MITVSDFRLRFPEFDGKISDAELLVLIEDSLFLFNIPRWGKFYTRGHCLYLAMMAFIRIAQRDGNASASVLELQSYVYVDGLSYTTTKPTNLTLDDSFYAGTTYGREFLKLKKIISKGSICY